MKTIVTKLKENSFIPLLLQKKHKNNKKIVALKEISQISKGFFLHFNSVRNE